ncbi:hypothetical protein Lesp02_31750 [Lentzea sp. NBRC 105346]|uniref:hypothetical protein n=1 Tax=Lentzea sp. NBRC 105346 TaxID=3032205 RepID=UPI0024A4689C|nr:hypothetical protein [Lentzea sp. NBRC 105346]GLZ30986.1 hypothetical protein Lesp02_31750 [Lentzea sp. NBRC 105346]
MYIDEPANAADQQPPPPLSVNGHAVALGTNVSAGQVSLDPATGDQLRKLLREQIDQVESWLERAGRLARPAPLGTNPVGDAMSSKFEARADGDQLSFMNVMTAYRTVLEQTHESVDTAIKNFVQVDDDHHGDMQKLSGS